MILQAVLATLNSVPIAVLAKNLVRADAPIIGMKKNRPMKKTKKRINFS